MEGNVCVVCYEEMSVPMYEKVDDTRVEGEYTRMKCGHAMHTECLIRSLQATQGQCALCNMKPDMTDNFNMQWRYTHECQKRLQLMKRNVLVREGLKDYEGFRSELTAKQREGYKRLKKFKEELRNELEIPKLLKDIAKIRTQTRKNFMKIAKEEGGIYLTTAESMRPWELDKWLFKEQRYSDWKMRRVFY